MKTKILRFLLPVLAVTILLPSGASADPGLFGKKKKKQTAAVSVKAADSTKKKTPYERIVKGTGVIANESEFISTYIQGGKLYFEIPTRYLERPMLLGTLTSETSRPGLPDQGYYKEAPMQVMFIRKDSTLLLERKNTNHIDYPEGENYRVALERNFLNEIFKKFKIEAWNSDSTAVLINVTDLFTKDEKALSPWGKPAQQGLVTEGKLIDANTILLGTKTFSDNVMVETDMSYSVNTRAKATNGVITINIDMGTVDARLKVKRTLALLPENKMHPRESDRRVGVFIIPGKRRVTREKDHMQYYSLFTKWRVEPADTAAWLRGELVPPAKQIVWYIDDAFPDGWIEPIRRGVQRWNKAFEEIGLKDVMVARTFPKDDPDFDPDNLKYSCIRYIPSATANAMGPSWWDYDTGEILNASVLIYSDITSMLYKWRLVQTGQADPAVRSDKLPVEVFDESLEYVVAHEIGHTLGLMHNMSASASYPVESLRDPEFTSRYGTTPSIMDYARFNYVAQPGDGVTSLGPPELGVYDYYAIKVLYQPVIGKTPADEKATIEEWIDSKEGDPMYHYGVQQIASFYDPRSLSEDLGDDPVRASTYGIKNLKHILPQLPDWIGNDPNNYQKFQVYSETVNQFYRYLYNVFMVVGGIEINNVKSGPGVTRFQPVARDRQKQAMRWVIEQLRDYDWINDTPIRKDYALTLDPSIAILKNIFEVQMLSDNTVGKVALSAHLSDDPYTVQDYADDIYTLVFANTVKGRKLTAGDKLMQRTLCAKVNSIVNPKSGGLFGLAAETDVTIEQLSELLPVDQYEEIISSIPCTHDGHIDIRTDHMWCCSPVAFGNDSPNRNSAYGFQGQVRVKDIDEWNGSLVSKAPELEKLLKQRIASGPSADRGHYMLLLNMIQKN